MIKSLPIVILMCSTLILSSPAFARWADLGTDTDGNTHYVETNSIKENGGYTYYWRLINNLKPDEYGDLSNKALYEAKCDIPIKQRILSFTFHSQPMGTGTTTATSSEPSDWVYPAPDSVSSVILAFACAHVMLLKIKRQSAN